jgi:hypothetical protein
VRSAVRAFAGRVETLELGEAPAKVYDPVAYAFVLKSSALAVRAEARAEGVDLRVAQGVLDAGDLEWQRALWAQETAAYVDVVPIRVRLSGREGEVAEAYATFQAEAVLNPPAPELWLYLEAPEGSSPYAAYAGAVEGLAAAAPVAFARLSGEEAKVTEQARWAAAVNEVLDRGFAPAPRGAAALEAPDGSEVPGGRILGRFLRGEDLATLIVYDAPAGEDARLIVDIPDVRNARVTDPATGQMLRTAPEAGAGAFQRTLRVALRGRPMLLEFDRVLSADGLEIPPEEVEVRTTRGLTAEEIIARYQQVQKVQDDGLERWSGRGRVDLRFRLAQAGGSVEISIESNYFWERGGQLEWEQTDYYVNGNRVTWKTIPELPLIQPEKVITVPLDLTLDKTYDYRLVGEDRVGDRAAYVLAFEPTAEMADRSLYRGRLWIDRETFVRLKQNVIQTNLEAPVLSNEEIDLYAPMTGPDGETYWMLSRIDGQQLWTAGGRNFVVRRELTFDRVEINPPRAQFDEDRRRAYASTHQMLRDTERGFRYLERQDDGSRAVKETVKTSQFFAAAGAFKDSSRDSVTPLAGVNYFDYDLWGKNYQFNVLFAGALAFVNLTNPDLFGRKIDLAVEVVGIAFKGDDKVFVADIEQEGERIRSRNQFINARLGLPIGDFFKITAAGNLQIAQYFRDDVTDPGFVLPRDHQVATGTLQAEFNRRGWSLTASGSWSRRSRWEAWGLPGGEGQPPEFDPAQKSYSQRALTAGKEWYLPAFQKLRANVTYLDGSDMDRFSRYRFNFFGDGRLNGFAGAGVRFDEGYILRTGYGFNLLGAVRLDLDLDTARVRDERSGTDWQNFTGAGLSGNVIGPWKTVVSFGYGRAVASDIPELKGKDEFLLLILKLF